jgi:HK97 gp10 family phage protein
MGTAAQIAAQLRNLVTNRTLTEAMTRSVLIVEGNAKRETPVKTGNLRRTITSRVEQGGKRGVVGTNAPYARPVHDGSRPHIITAKRAKALYWKGASHPVRSVKHPGNKPNPFFKRAADTSRGPVERELQAWGYKVLGGVK